jgi:ATP/maltotriose-dependent transcriptional regulator MalT
MVRGMAQLVGHGFPAGTDLLRQGVAALREKESYDESDLSLLLFSAGITYVLWDLDAARVLDRRMVELARDSGALQKLPVALGCWAETNVWTGDFQAAEAALAEGEAVEGATNARVSEMGWAWVDAWRLPEAEALERIDLEARVHSGMRYQRDCARAVAHVGAGRYDAALEAAERSCKWHPQGSCGAGLIEVVEAGAHCGQTERARVAFEQLVERTQLSGTDWALGLEARSRAVISEDRTEAEKNYRAAIEWLSRAGARPDLGRAHLLYGEWLRRASRRVDAREQLRKAVELFDEMGVPGFGARARRELAATGEAARKRTDETRADLTAQEAQIARLALQGLTNPQIGAQLFLSARTIEWHLRHIYPKLGIRSRRELHTVLSTI